MINTIHNRPIRLRIAAQDHFFTPLAHESAAYRLQNKKTVHCEDGMILVYLSILETSTCKPHFPSLKAYNRSKMPLFLH